MLYYKVHLEGTEEELENIIDKLSEFDEMFSDVEVATDFDFTDEGNPEISDVGEVEDIALELKPVAPNAKFMISGAVENHDYYMDFEIVYESGRLTKRVSDWYTSYFISKFNYEDYEEFCDYTDLGEMVSKEQFEELLKEECEIVVIDGEETVYKKAPLSDPIELCMEQPDVCPICGEALDHITPNIRGKNGKLYHIWCAEDAKIEGDME